MSQHDYNIANQTFPATRTDLNNALGAVATNNSGNSAPATTYSTQWFFDNDDNKLYLRNKDNDAWVEILTIGATSDAVESIGATGRFNIASTETVFNESSADIDFRVESNGNANMLFVDAGSNTIGIGTATSGTSSHNFGGEHNLTLGGATTNSFSVMEIAGNDADNSAYVGAIEFVNKNNSDAGSSTAEGIAALATTVVTSDSNAQDDSGGNLVFFTKVEAGNMNERMRIDSSGKVGIGTSSPDTILSLEENNAPRIQFKDTSGGTDAKVWRAIGHDGGFQIETRSDNLSNGQLASYIERSGYTVSSHQFYTNGSERMRIDSSGRLAVGNTSPKAALHVTGSNGILVESENTNGDGQIYFGDTTGTDRLYLSRSLNDFAIWNVSNGIIKLATNNAERMRILSDGSVAIKSTTTDNSILKVQQDTADRTISRFEHHNGSGNNYGLRIEYKGQAPDNNTSDFLVCGDTGASRMIIYSDGDIQNHDNAYGAISDERIKQDIRDSNSQWNDIKAVKVRNFKKKDDVRQYGDNAWEQIGVVAQELEAVSPKLIRHNNPTSHDILSDSSFGTLWTADDPETQDAVEEVLYTADDPETQDVLYTSDDVETQDVLYTEDDELPEGVEVGDVKEPASASVGDVKTQASHNVGDVKIEAKPSTEQIGEVKEINEQVKSVNYSILYMKAIKALQEAMDRIETLESKVATLEGE